MRTTMLLAIALCLIVSSNASRAQDQADQLLSEKDWADIDQELEQLMVLYAAPSLSVAVVRDGEIVYAKAFGFSNLSSQTPATQSAQYAIGSIAKTLSIGVVGALEDEGLLSLSTPVSEYLEGIELTSIDAEENLTVARLLSQTSGLADLSGSLAFFPVPDQIDILPRLGH
ncbi:MAG: serine hydrolase domain-containing protein [Pseudomonadota bacterium]